MRGNEIYEALLTLRQFHVELAQMLKTADTLMHTAGFPTLRAVGNTASAYYSYTIDKPEQWTPEFVFRWYSVDKSPNTAAFTAAILCPRELQPGVPPFTEPLLSVGIAHFEGGMPSGSKLYHYARSINWVNVERDGTWATHAPGAEAGARVDMDVMAVPLTDVLSTQQLQERGTDRLIERIELFRRTRSTPKTFPG